MLQDDDENLSFYDDNERYANKIATAIFEWSLIVGPILLLAKYLHIFDEVEYRILFIYIGLSVFFTVWVELLVHKTPQSRVVKFICVSFEEMLICYLATTHGISIYITYIVPVIFTCLYHNHRFTHGVMLVGFILMLGSIVYRGFFPTTAFVQNIEPWKYILYYGCGLSI